MKKPVSLGQGFQWGTTSFRLYNTWCHWDSHCCLVQRAKWNSTHLWDCDPDRELWLPLFQEAPHHLGHPPTAPHKQQPRNWAPHSQQTNLGSISSSLHLPQACMLLPGSPPRIPLPGVPGKRVKLFINLPRPTNATLLYHTPLLVTRSPHFPLDPPLPTSRTPPSPSGERATTKPVGCVLSRAFPCARIPLHETRIHRANAAGGLRFAQRYTALFGQYPEEEAAELRPRAPLFGAQGWACSQTPQAAWGTKVWGDAGAFHSRPQGSPPSSCVLFRSSLATSKRKRFPQWVFLVLPAADTWQGEEKFFVLFRFGRGLELRKSFRTDY